MRPDETALERLQRRFFALVVAPEGVAKALPILAAEDPEAVPLDRWIAPPPGRGPDAVPEAVIARLDVYANMYFYRLLAVLREDYPKVLAVAGDAPFHNFATDYLLAHPPTDPSVRHVGRHLADFLRGHALAAAHPILPDLAALEWARLAVFDAANAELLTDDELRRLAPEHWGDLPIRLGPAVRLLALGHNAHDVWLALERGEPPPANTVQGPRLVVWRSDFQARHREVNADEWQDLSLAREGIGFGALCERLAARVGDAAAAPLALERLTAWVGQRLLVRSAGAP